jgi:protein-disulfide isomerase
VFPGLKTRYIDTGKVIFAFKYFPLPQHAFAATAAMAAECARRQGRFWDLHAALFAKGPKLDEPQLQAAAVEVGLPIEPLKACMSADAGSVVEQDLATARRLHLKATPTFMFGEVTTEGTVRVRKTIAGVASAAAFYQALDQMLR